MINSISSRLFCFIFWFYSHNRLVDLKKISWNLQLHEYFFEFFEFGLKSDMEYTQLLAIESIF